MRVAFAQEPAAGEDPALRRALETLATYTATPDTGYAAIWEGWAGTRPLKRRSCRFLIEECCCSRDPIRALRDAPALAWYGAARGYQEPHLVWPEDQAWCLACEVDEEVEFTVGCSIDASEALAGALPDAVRPVHYGDPAPLYRNPG